MKLDIRVGEIIKAEPSIRQKNLLTSFGLILVKK